MLESIYKDVKEKMNKTIISLQNEFKIIRSGRAHPSMLDNIQVEYYGNMVPIKQIANITTPEMRLLVIQPWDKSVLGAIEKAILKSNLGITPNNDGKVIRLNLPQLTEEQRKNLAKIAHKKSEDFKVAIRNIRRDGNEAIKKIEKDGHISEDDTKYGLDEIQKITDEYIKKIDELLKQKEKEIMQI